jgi:tight adherence protein C
MSNSEIALLVALGAVAVSMRVFSAAVRRRTADLVDASIEAAGPVIVSARDEAQGWLSRWLYLAGFRQPFAVSLFLGSSAAALAVGAAAAYALGRFGVIDSLAASLSNIPGGVGDTLRGIIELAPWISVAVLGCVPLLVVRAARRERVSQIEQDLPLALDLFATLAEAGLGFDASLAKIQESQPPGRALTMEFHTFQREMLAGVPRVQCLRGLARRIETTSMTVLVSALIQAEQIGASLAETLRHQAEDMRDRRRTKAIMLAQALPVKLVVPLVVCFLPGVLVTALGPVLQQLIKVADSVIRTAR